MKSARLLLIVLSFLFFTGTQDSNAGNKDAKQIDKYFRNTYYTGTEYLWLRSDGTYRRFNREHMGIFLSDKGIWLQKGDEFILRSEQRVKHVVYNPLQIYLYHYKANDKALSDFLVSIKKAAMDFLNKNKGNNFSSNRIEKIHIDKASKLPNIKVLAGVNIVKRGELEGLIKAIDDFLASNEKNVFRIRQINYKSFTFIIWLDELQVFGNNIEEVKKKIDELPKGQELAMIFVETNKDVFDKEYKSTQPFMFHPEMNKCVPQPRGDEIK